MAQEIIDHLIETIATTNSILVKDFANENLIIFQTALLLRQTQQDNPQLGTEDIIITRKRNL